MEVKYKWREGMHIKGVTARTVGETLADLAQAQGGRLTPAAVVDRAEPADSPIHDAGFTWDDGEAAAKCREDEARVLMRSYVVIYEDRRGDEHEVIANVSVAERFDKDGPEYMPTRTAMDDAELRARVLAAEVAQLRGWVQRCKYFPELTPLVHAVERAIEEYAEAKPGRPRRARRAPETPPPGDRPRPRRRRRADDRPQPGL